jgi:integrase
MADVNFNLNDKKAKNKTSIILVFNYDNQRIKASTGYSIPVKYWSYRKQRVANSIEFPDNVFINDKLEALRTLMLDLYKKYKSENIIPVSKSLKNEFLLSINNPKMISRKKSFWDYFEDFIEYKREELKDIRDYNKSLRKHLKKAEEIFGNPITFEAIKKKNGGFISRMDKYLTYEAINSKGSNGLSVNTVGKQFKNLKVFMNWCFDNDIYTPFSLKHIITKTEEVDNIYLKENELDDLEKLHLVDKTESLVRDLFLIGCETGLRFNDFSSLRKEYLKDGEIHLRPKKTEGKVLYNNVVIPVRGRLKRILKKYDNIPPQFSYKKITTFNKITRKLCDKANIKDDIILIKNEGGKRTENSFKKYELASSHTCRRTFCTLKYLKGMEAQDIMLFSGHKTERAFKRYLKLDALDAAKRNAHFFE